MLVKLRDTEGRMLVVCLVKYLVPKKHRGDEPSGTNRRNRQARCGLPW